MSLQYQFRPIDVWPGQATQSPMKSKFHTSWGQTLILLERELGRLQAKNIVLQAYVTEGQIKRDGMLYADARPTRPGVILSFDSKHGPLSYPCDRFTDWQDNVRAIALSLEALRTVDRYGVTKQAEQYKGWAKLPGPVAQPTMGVNDAARVLREHAGMNGTQVYRENIEEMYRKACAATHPDRGGSATTFKLIQEAKATLDKYFSAPTR